MTLVLLVYVLCILFYLGCGLEFNGIRKERIKIKKQGSLGVRLGADFKVLEVINDDSMLQMDDRITAINGENIVDYEFDEFKEALAKAQVPFVLSIERLYLDKERVNLKKETVQFMDNNDHEEVLSESLHSLRTELGLHMPVVSIKGGKSVDFSDFTSEAAEFSGPFSCDYQSLRIATPIDGCQVSARDKKKRVYRDSIVLVQRGVCPFIAKALNAQDAGAKGIVIVNTEENIFPIKDPQAEKVQIPVVMVSKSHGRDILNMAGFEGGKVAKNVSPMTRIAPPNACLGARQREHQLRDQGLTHAQKLVQGSTSRTPVEQSRDGVTVGDSADSGRKDGEMVATKKLDQTFEAMVKFNERKESEKLEKLKAEKDAHWIAKSSQGTHGFHQDTQSRGVDSTELDDAEASVFGSLTLQSKSGDPYIEADYMKIYGSFDHVSTGCGVVYARLPFHTAGDAKAGTSQLDPAYVEALIAYTEEFIQQLSGATTTEANNLIIIDLAPLTKDEVNRRGVATFDPSVRTQYVTNTLDILSSVRSNFSKMESSTCGGVFFLSLPGGDSSKELWDSDSIAPQLEYYNWSYPFMEEVYSVIADSEQDATHSKLLLPTAIFPTMQSALLRTIFQEQHYSELSGSALEVSRLNTRKSELKDKWMDMWAVIREVGPLPDVRVRKKILYMMKLKYSGEQSFQ
mmetsp:Transcript_231/g.476  ORF Transcript_231/g.476 Transcript_231/m.476 type:complete len:685 (+) Transcript_231:162-2216(+)